METLHASCEHVEFAGVPVVSAGHVIISPSSPPSDRTVSSVLVAGGMDVREWRNYKVLK